MRTVPTHTDHVVVVGAGLAGLSATLHLLGAGRAVTLLESETTAGGRVSGREFSGHRMDTGASVLTMPELLDEAFAAVGESAAQRLRLTRLHPAYRAHFADGESMAVYSDAEAMEAEIRRVAGPGDAEGYRLLRNWLSDLYAVQREHFLGANFDSPLQLLRPELAKLAALGGFGRLGPHIGRFLADERVRRLFSFQSLYAGLDPMRAIAAYGVISYMDTVAGVYYPQGGMAQVPAAMLAAAQRAGATVHLGTPATRLEGTGGKVTGVTTPQGTTIGCDAVVLATELDTAYRLLGRRPRRPIAHRYSPSAVLLHGHAAHSWPELNHHTIFFGKRWRRTFTEIIHDGTLMSDPSLLVTRPTATDKSLAPADREAISVLAPAPNLRRGEIDWPRIGPAYQSELLETLSTRGLTGIETDLRVEQLITPEDWAARGLAAGTPFSLAHTFTQTGPFRPGNMPRGVDNVVLAGCGTTPGVGIPPVLISGRLAAARIHG